MRAAVDLKPKPIEEIQNPIEEILATKCLLGRGSRFLVSSVQTPLPAAK
jgi:hypothetical protein